MKKALFVMTAGGALWLAACNKERTPTQRERQLTARDWKLTDITRKSVNNPEQDSSILKNCTADDAIRFASSSRRFELSDGNNKCDSVIFNYENGTWYFDTNEARILLDGQKKDQIWTIQTLNDSILRVSWLDSIAPTNKTLKTISFKNK